MSKQLIISVGREFGSGGHEIARQLAEHYNIQLLDNNLLHEVVRERNLDVKDFEGLDEKHNRLVLSRTVKGFSNSPEENVSRLQFDYLKRKAARGDSFVIVGRCSENVLKEYEEMISVFVVGDMKCKIQRIMESHQISEKQAEKLITEMDRKRKKYHDYFSEGKWGDSRNYDICVNSSKLGIEETVKLLIAYIDKRN